MKVKVKNVGVIKNTELEFIPGLNLIIGSSGSGKSTLIRTIQNMAMNNFSDSDISFGKSSMSVTIESNNNVVTYSRTTDKSANDKCYYDVNGDRFVKLGRTPLPQVSDVLRFGDIEINNDKINFNFNLQFSTPFLILGSQSTLYNVLTYRSSFDISSINDYYISDVKCNNTEISTNTKIKLKFEDTLNSLEQQANKLSLIEEVYSKFIEYKHKHELLLELQTLLQNMITVKDFESKINQLDQFNFKQSKVISNFETVINLNNYISKFEEINTLNNRIKQYDKIITQTNSLANKVQIWSNLYRLNACMSMNEDLSKTINRIYKCDTQINNCLNKESLINNVHSLYMLLSQSDKINKVISTLNKSNGDTISTIECLLQCQSLLQLLVESNNQISLIDNKLNNINDAINKFDVCPLCGNHLKGECYV